ncbi:MAG TPA: helix-hairpin-helix domain-containing protein, partial [Saprospiraceae bacterium]|nr:helix-hairpin-helix domain-containing protein [Saprospiraceae bacterium]
DLRKLYAMDEKTYVKIQPFLIFSQVDHSLKTKYKQPNKVFQSIDINTATEVQLIELPGIGKYYARIILNWRNKLGGFSNIDQIKSTYNLPDSIFNKITEYIRFSTPPTQINVNTSDAYTLAKHFYIKAKEAQIIVNYRNNHGPYAQVDDLIKTGALTKEWLTKVGPYLKVSN